MPLISVSVSLPLPHTGFYSLYPFLISQQKGYLKHLHPVTIHLNTTPIIFTLLYF